MTTTQPRSSGELLRELHAGAWRAVVPPLDVTLPELLTVLFPLIESGSVGLVWPRLRFRAACYGAAGTALADGYETVRHTLEARELLLARVVATMRHAGLEPVLLKGWSLSRLYPSPTLRSPGDIDLWVPAAQFATAEVVLQGQGAESEVGLIDLHQDPHWPDSERIDFRDRAQVVQAAGVDVLVPCPEDHLRLLCLHFLGHGAHRPLWLCDIALLMETSDSEFDWERCLGRNKRLREWICTVLMLAHDLLDARIDSTPGEVRHTRLPSWLQPAVLRRWERGPQTPPQVVRELVADPRSVIAVFRERWPEPITATVRIGVGFTEFPRMPIQCAAFLKQIAKFPVTQLPQQTRQYLRPSIVRRTARRAGA